MPRRRLRPIVTTVLVVAAMAAVTGVIAHSVVPSASAAPAAPLLDSAQIDSAPAASLFRGGLSVPTQSQAATAVAGLTREGKRAEAATVAQIAAQPVSLWLGDWYSDDELVSVIRGSLADAAKQGATPSFVLYAIPNRDCGDYSSGGFTASEYEHFVGLVAKTLQGRRAVVLDEPDALAMLSNCPSEASTRIPLIKESVRTLARAGVATYLDGGNSHWVDPATMAARLTAARVDQARGFFSNVSNFYPTADETAYDDTLSGLTGGAHYVIDTSRNGQGWKGTWCNPSGAGLGLPPAVADGTTKLDATLWVKTPGASDGTCNGGPAAGSWWTSYALALVKNRAK
ncbi:glycoside hydrolase family 6 protein [Frondihabitans cladoniiphilus]|uniref:Glucanase n=1 Tax=Frondihabitans cladoniiphilus TaxID=715785 RepID=A0ABP8VT34_9MICO